MTKSSRALRKSKLQEYTLTKQRSNDKAREERERETRNSISSFGKLSKNEIRQPNNYKRYLSVFEEEEKKNFMLRQAWTDGHPVSSILTDRTDFEMLRQSNEYPRLFNQDLTNTERNFENIKRDNESDNTDRIKEIFVHTY